MTSKLIIPLSGRLGNQLFQLAAGDHLAKLSGARIGYIENLYSAETDYRGSIFNREPVYSSRSAACSGSKFDELPRASIDCSNIQSTLLRTHLRNSSPCNIFQGLFQCAEVAAQGRMAVVHALQQQSSALKKAQNNIAHIRNHFARKAQLVAMHIRRGDYTKRFNRGLLEPLPISYYRAAMLRVPHGMNATFLIFSDDLRWCRQELAAEKAAGVNILFVRVLDPIEALLTMALADHHIIANSTFSWWAAFLYARKGQFVFAPRPWFGPRQKESLALIPDHWIQLDLNELEVTDQDL